ncbi:MAG: decaprenyl-phosphate phosphoribosyltransferase [Oscillospiraceae bacterium]|jgi:4-hydroxybenzoate polyprenyltransferase|nr:decaprenyl-phosphate phosphoribosyltransferase [Oscillospiraceae bacterium]
MKACLTLLRPKHAVKNLLIWLPLIFSGRLFQRASLLSAALGFVAFCCAASAVYVINDMWDAPSDRRHTTKRLRPIACGAVSLRAAAYLATLALSLACGILAAAGFPWAAWATLGLYLLLNAGYSVLGWKRVPLLDVAILAAGFVLRVLFGAVITGIQISNWLYLTVFALSFYMGLGKRRGEALRETTAARPVLTRYTRAFLEQNMHMCLTLAVVFYALWCVDPATVARHANAGAVWTVPLVLLLTMRYSMVAEGDSDGDPVEVILRDKPLLILGALYAACMLVIVYGLPGA